MAARSIDRSWLWYNPLVFCALVFIHRAERQKSEHLRALRQVRHRSTVSRSCSQCCGRVQPKPQQRAVCSSVRCANTETACHALRRNAAQCVLCCKIACCTVRVVCCTVRVICCKVRVAWHLLLAPSQACDESDALHQRIAELTAAARNAAAERASAELVRHESSATYEAQCSAERATCNMQ